MNYKEIKTFASPLRYSNYSEFLYLDQHCDQYIRRAKEEQGSKFGVVNHSINLTADNTFKPLTDLVGKASLDFLYDQGVDTSKYTTMFTEMWVQFPEQGGGYHETHVHYNQHISGFYFLRCNKNTSYPVFYDPRPGALMTKLEQRDKNKISDIVPHLVYEPSPGDLVLFNSYMPHSFVMDAGKNPFRFIHFNLQAFPNQVVNNG